MKLTESQVAVRLIKVTSVLRLLCTLRNTLRIHFTCFSYNTHIMKGKQLVICYCYWWWNWVDTEPESLLFQ